MKRKLMAMLLVGALGLGGSALAAAPASAGDIVTEPRWCEVEENEDCPEIRTQLRIAERRPHGPRFQTVTVDATNMNIDTNGGALDARLVVTFQRNTAGSQPRTVLATLVEDGGGTFSASFEVRRRRYTDALVTATIEDVLCDGVNETVALH